MTKVVKYERGMELLLDHLYIGRKFACFEASKWANPFTIPKDGYREEVCEKYRAYIRSRPDLMEALGELVGKTLICWCGGRDTGKLCHGDILIDLMKECGIG